MLNNKKLKIINILIILLIILFAHQNISAQNTPTQDFKTAFRIPSDETSIEIMMNQQFYTDSSLDLDIKQNIKALSIDIDVELKKQNSFARVVLVDTSGNEFLVYQAGFPFEGLKSLTDVCEETCIMQAIKPDKLIIELSNDDSNLFFEKINYLVEGKAMKKGVTKSSIRKSQKELKIKKFEEKPLTWTPGDTPLAELSYSEKKSLFGGVVWNNMWI